MRCSFWPPSRQVCARTAPASGFPFRFAIASSPAPMVSMVSNGTCCPMPCATNTATLRLRSRVAASASPSPGMTTWRSCTALTCPLLVNMACLPLRAM